MASKLPSAARVTARAQKDRAFLKRALKDPGLRSRITDTKLLPAAVAKQRALNVRLNAPITPGSSTTERDLARAANAATAVRYGPQEADLQQQQGLAQQQQHDTGGYYDQYLAQLGQYQKNIGDIQQGAAQGLQGIAQGITGLGQQGLAQIQNPANADAASRGAQAGDLSQMASSALGIRQALIGSFQAQQQLTGATAQNYASGLANVVGPAQKLTALAEAAGKVADVTKKQTDLATQKGTYNEQYRDEQRAAEGKNVLAQQALGLNTAKEQATEAAGRSTRRETRRAHKANEALTTTRLHDARVKAKDSASKAANKRATTGPFAGLTQREIDNLSDDQAKSRVTAYQNKSSGSMSTKEANDFYAKYGVKPQGTSAVARGRDTVSTVGSMIGKFKGVPKTKAGYDRIFNTLVQGQASKKGTGGEDDTPGIAKQNPLWTRVALDQWLYGGVTNTTADKLHHAGYSVKTLGLKPFVPNKQAQQAANAAAGAVKGAI